MSLLLIHNPKASISQDWNKLKVEPRSFIQGSYMEGSDPNT